MRDIPEALQDRLSGDVLTLCLCWRLTRRDGQVFGLTDHDSNLTIEGILYAPGAALDSERFVQSIDLAPGQAVATGRLSSDLITQDDLKAGLWDGCRVDVLRADWTALDLGQVLIWSGYLTEVTASEDGRFQARLASLKADLERPVGRILQRQCDALLGDERCGAEANGQTCDQRFETCRDRFSNVENFRGFPHLPGNDFVLSGPAASGNDGGKR